MITVKGKVATFTSKDWTLLKKGAKETGLSLQDYFTGITWEMIMRQARRGDFLVKSKKA